MSEQAGLHTGIVTRRYLDVQRYEAKPHQTLARATSLMKSVLWCWSRIHQILATVNPQDEHAPMLKDEVSHSLHGRLWAISL
jgi:hypothetical protein